MTNKEHIQSMNTSELAKFISEITLVCEYCAGRDCSPEECSLGDCQSGIETWLNSEYEQD